MSELFRGAVAARGWRGTLYSDKRVRVWTCSHNHPTEGQARRCAGIELTHRKQDRSNA